MMKFSLLMLFSLCFSRNIDKDRFVFDKLFTIKKFDFSTKKNNICLRLIGRLNLWN